MRIAGEVVAEFGKLFIEPVADHPGEQVRDVPEFGMGSIEAIQRTEMLRRMGEYFTE